MQRCILWTNLAVITSAERWAKALSSITFPMIGALNLMLVMMYIPLFACYISRAAFRASNPLLIRGADFCCQPFENMVQ